MSAFLLRPGTDLHPMQVQRNMTDDDGSEYVVNVTIKDPCYLLKPYNHRDQIVSFFLIRIYPVLDSAFVVVI